MPTIRSSLIALAATAVFLASTTAIAHPKLVSTTPAEHAAVAAPTRIVLAFSETLLPVSGAELTLVKMPGMAMSPMKVDMKAALSGDAKSLVLTPAHALGTGSYRVDWHVVSADTHAAKGSFEFSVK